MNEINYSDKAWGFPIPEGEAEWSSLCKLFKKLGISQYSTARVKEYSFIVASPSKGYLVQANPNPSSSIKTYEVSLLEMLNILLTSPLEIEIEECNKKCSKLVNEVTRLTKELEDVDGKMKVKLKELQSLHPIKETGNE